MEKRWTPSSAVKKADDYVVDVNVPLMKIDLGEREELDFNSLNIILPLHHYHGLYYMIY